MKTVGPAIGKLISIGTLVTLVGGGIAAHYIMDLSWEISLQFSALIIVTGPTVIAPILRNVPLNRNISTVLKWESILIDLLCLIVKADSTFRHIWFLPTRKAETKTKRA